VQLIPLDDFNDPLAGACGGQRGAWPLISGVGEDAKDEGPHGTCAWAQHKRCAVAILNVGGVDGNAQQEAERIDEYMPLAARDLLAGVITLRIEQSPPFGAALALWLSMMAAVGLASRPSFSRTAM
jgi:hypothetical protein